MMRAAIKKKSDDVERLTGQIRNAKVVGFLRLKNLPDKILQGMKKKLRSKVGFKAAKSTVIRRALDNAGFGTEMIEGIKEPLCIFWSNEMTSYEIFRFIKENKSKAAAKPGQIAPFEIMVHEGETDLVPGPALTELKQANINAQVKAGKIVIAKDSIAAKKGDKITSQIASALQKLSIFPFEVGAELIATKEQGFIFTSDVLDIDPATLTQNIQIALTDGLAFSFNQSVPSAASIDLLLGMSYSQALGLGINEKIYSPTTIEMLLSQATGIGNKVEQATG